MSEILTRAIPGSVESISVSFADGQRGVARFEHLLKDSGVLPSQLRLDTVRPSKDGDSLEVDRHMKDDRGRQLPDETVSIPSDRVKEAMVKSEANSPGDLVHHQVVGQFGPMTLTFKFQGRHIYADASLPDAVARRLLPEDVQEWYTRNGWPKAGMMKTDHKGRYAGLWQMM